MLEMAIACAVLTYYGHWWWAMFLSGLYLLLHE